MPGLGGMPSSSPGPSKRYTGRVNPATGLPGQGGGAAQGGVIGGGANLPSRGTPGMMGGIMAGGMNLGAGRSAAGPGGMMTSGAPTPSAQQQAPQPMQQQLNIPQQQQFNPYQAQQINYQPPGAGQLGQNLGQMGEFATGMMDPESDYFKRLMSGMQGQIGSQAAAQQRAAALRAAYGGMGAGRGGEMMQTQADIGQAGLEAAGAAGANLRMQAPQMGMQALQSTFAPQLGVQQLGEQGRQFGAGQQLTREQMAQQGQQFGAQFGEQGRQFGVGAGLQSQQMAQQAAIQQWQMQQQQQMQQQAQQQSMMQMMAGML